MNAYRIQQKERVFCLIKVVNVTKLNEIPSVNPIFVACFWLHAKQHSPHFCIVEFGYWTIKLARFAT